MGKRIVFLIITLFSLQLNKAQQIGNGLALPSSNFNFQLLSGGYNGCGENIPGAVPDKSHPWQHLLTIRHDNSQNNNQLQIGASFSENDRLFFRKIATGNNDGSSNWNEIATRGTNIFTGDQTINGLITISGKLSTTLIRPIDSGSGAIDFTNNGFGYQYAAKIFTFRSPDYSEAYGITNDYGPGTSAHLSIIAKHEGGNIGFYTGKPAVEKMRILSNGNIGIGTASPQGNLHIGKQEAPANTAGEVARLILQPYGHTGGPWRFICRDIPGNAFLDLYYGTNQSFTIHHSGNVGIGTTNPQNLLDVNGTIHAREVKVDLTGWSDFVFHPTYQLKPLAEVEKYIKANGHLQDIPTAAEVEQNGVNVGEMQKKLLQKVEELTLYVIQQQKEIENLKKQISAK